MNGMRILAECSELVSILLSTARRAINMCMVSAVALGVRHTKTNRVILAPGMLFEVPSSPFLPRISYQNYLSTHE